MTPLIIAAALSLLALDSGPATSQPGAAAPDKAATSHKSKDADDPDKMICRNQPITGSRFVRRVCMTRAQWDERQRQYEQLQRRIDQNPNAAQGGGLGGG